MPRLSPGRRGADRKAWNREWIPGSPSASSHVRGERRQTVGPLPVASPSDARWGARYRLGLDTRGRIDTSNRSRLSIRYFIPID
jgi:hypothetical protein